MKTKRFRSTEPTFPGSLLRGVLLALLFTAALLAIFALLCQKSADPTAPVRPLSAVALVVSSFLCGFLPGRFYRKRGLLIGLLGGVILSLLTAISSLLLSGPSSPPAAMRLLCYPAILLLSTLGGLAGGAKKHIRRRRPGF